MLTLRVTSLNGQAPARPIEATFDEAGGTIGRADDNHLVLPDTQRHISRLHARIVLRSGAFELVDQGGNPIDVNGVPVGRGDVVRLQTGDQLRIGGYAISVVASTPAGAAGQGVQGAAPPLDDPFGGLLGPGPGNDPAGPAPRAAPADPFAGFGALSAADPLGLGFGARAPLPRAPSPSPARAAPAGAIPDDFDPFADPFAGKPAAAPPANVLPDDFDLGLGGPGGTAQSIDSMFDLPPASGTDPFAGGALSRPAGHYNAPAPVSLDPLAPWQSAVAAPTAAPVPDRVPEIHGSFKPPIARPEPAPPAAPRAPQPATPAPAQGGVFLSWEDGAASGDSVAAAPPAPPPGNRPDPLLEMFGGAPCGTPGADPLGLDGAPPPAVGREPAEVVTTMPIVQRAPQSALLAPTAAPASRDQLTLAFLSGLGATNLPLREMTPEMLERIGQLLREATQGTLDLLLARAMTKREVRAEVTMIIAKNNNPLKFSPDVAVALAHLITPQGSGFLPPVAAMRDAYDDLRLHQFGFMAGLRAALAGVLQRFDPAVLEQRLLHKSVLDSVLPMNRRAKLWDLYEQLYRDIASEAEDDFHTLFGREFLRAYEEQVALLGERKDPAP